jgi:hypothetical protein
MMLGQIGGGKSDFTLSPGKKIVNISGLCLSYFWPDKIMPRKLKIVIGLVAVALFNGALFAASFTASLDRDTITFGEQATLSLTFEGGQPANVSMPQVSGLQMNQVGNSSQTTSDFNGHSSFVTTILVAVIPRQIGEFTIPALTADVNGQHLSTAPLKLTVQNADAPTAAIINSGSEVAFMKLILPQKKVYVGQTLTALLQIYLRDDVQNYGQPQFTGTPADGLTLGKSAGGGQSQTRVGSRVYTVLPISIALTAVKSGTLTLGPFTANMVVVVPPANQGDNPLSRFGFGGEQKRVSLATEQISVQSLPLPKENVPADFNGAIGNFSLNVSAGPTNLTVGDPVTVRVQISGRGALDAIALPAQNSWHDFKVFPPTAKLETHDQFGLQGTKTFEQIVSPQNSDVRELPPFAFSFFNPDDGKYYTRTQLATPLVVRSAGSTPLPTIAGNKNSNAENPASPQDILPIKENLGRLAKAGTSLIASPKFLAVQSLPVIAFLAAFIWRKRTDNLANNPRLRRQRAVAQLVSGGLSDLNRFAAENKSDEFFALLFRLLQEQLGERLDCPAAAITESVVDERLGKMGVSAATQESLHELFQLCNQARYAPVRGTSELNSVAAKFEKTVGELQEVKA